VKDGVACAGLCPAIHVLQTIYMTAGYVYFLTNRPNGILYVGVTNNLVRRVYEHRSALIDGFTKRCNLKRLVCFERFDDIQNAIQREHNIKHWPRAWKVHEARHQFTRDSPQVQRLSTSSSIPLTPR